MDLILSAVVDMIYCVVRVSLLIANWLVLGIVSPSFLTEIVVI